MLGTRADWRGHMERAAAEIGVQGLRMHGAHAPRPASCASASPKTPAMGGDGACLRGSARQTVPGTIADGPRPRQPWTLLCGFADSHTDAPSGRRTGLIKPLLQRCPPPHAHARQQHDTIQVSWMMT